MGTSWGGYSGCVGWLAILSVASLLKKCDSSRACSKRPASRSPTPSRHFRLVFPALALFSIHTRISTAYRVSYPIIISVCSPPCSPSLCRHTLNSALSLTFPCSARPAPLLMHKHPHELLPVTAPRGYNQVCRPPQDAFVHLGSAKACTIVVFDVIQRRSFPPVRLPALSAHGLTGCAFGNPNILAAARCLSSKHTADRFLGTNPSLRG